MPSKSSENQGLFHATLGLDFTVEEMHYEHSMYSSKSSKEGDAISERELWVECEATMPPLGANRTVYPYTRQLFLGSLAQSFNRFDSILSSSSSAASLTPFLPIMSNKNYRFNREFINLD